MNNDNFLMSLLGVTSANPAVTKASAARARAESTEKFQQTLEQVRPEVAARKPAARKENLPAESVASHPEPKTIQRNSLPEKRSAAEPAHKRAHTQDVTSQMVEKSQSLERDKGVGESAENNPVNSQSSGSVPAEAPAQTTEAGEVDETPINLVAMDNALLRDAVADGASGFALASSENLLAPISALATDMDELPVADNEQTQSDDALMSGLGLEVLSPLLVAQTSAVLPGLAAESLPPLAATAQTRLGQVASELSLASVAVDAQVGGNQATTGGLVGLSGDELGADGTEAQVDLGTGSATDEGENPDFLLLSSKAAQNKLAETIMTAASLDKSASAADGAKPAAALTPAIETLTRLADAQPPSARGFVVQTGVPVPVGTPQWSQAVGDKVLWLAAQHVSSAEIRLDPPELGPMQVKVSLNQDQASVSFTSPHPAVREALDQQLGRLREMFSEQGLHLLNVDVSDRSFAQQEREQKESTQSSSGGESLDDELTPIAVSQTISMRLVDHYA